MGYLGMVGGPNPCADQIESVYASSPIAFRASPYGIGGFSFTNGYAPYLIDPSTLKIVLREDLAIGPFTGGPGQLNFACQMDDSTMIFSVHGGSGPYTSRLRVLTRSGISIAMSAEQQSVSPVLPEATVLRLDSSHVLRRYTLPGGVGFAAKTVVQVFSVSGGSLSLVATSSYDSANYTVTNDPGDGGGTVLISAALFPFHWDSSSTLYCWGFGAGFSGFPRVHAVPFSLGGSITAPPGLSWRSKDAQILGLSKLVGKVGSSECVVSRQSGGAGVGFYDDGSQMHYGPSSNWVVAAYAERDDESTYGDYLTADVVEYPQGTPVAGTVPALVSQSGTVLTYTPISPVIVRCAAVTGVQFAGSNGPTRHDTALGATATHIGGGVYRLWAFRW